MQESNVNETSNRILLVEDDSTNKVLIEMVLKKIDIEVVSVSNGKEAIERYKQENFKCILMDIQMPVMDGVLATSEIRKIEKENNRKTIIIALTAYALVGDKEKFLNQGMDDYISKPIDVNDFSKKIQKIYLTN